MIGSQQGAVHMANDISIRSSDSTIEGYEYSAIVSGEAEVGRYFRLAFNAENPEPWKHADDVIIDIIRRNPQQPGVDDEDYNEAILEQMAEFEPQTLAGTAMDVVAEQAKSFDKLVEEAAAILNRDEALKEIFIALDEASKMDYMGPVHVHTRIAQLVDSNPELWNLLPEPGTTKEYVEGTNEPYDKYPKTIVSSSGSRRIKVFSRIEELAKLLSVAVAAKQKSEALKVKIADKQAIAFNQADKSNYDKTVNVVKRHFKLAVNLLHKFKQVDVLTNLSVKYFLTTEGQTKGLVRTTPRPISIYDKHNAVEKQGAFTCSQFALMNPRKALRDVIGNPLLNQFDALVNSVEGRETGEATTYTLPKNMEQGEDMLNTFVTYLMDGDVFKLWLDYMTKAGGKEARSACKRLGDRLNVLASVKPAEESTRDKLIEAAKQRAATK